MTSLKYLVDKLGLSLSYDSVPIILASVVNAVCELYEEVKVLCPPKMRRFILTAAITINRQHLRLDLFMAQVSHSYNTPYQEQLSMQGEDWKLNKALNCFQFYMIFNVTI